MKRINEVFTDEEHTEIIQNKDDITWHDFLLMLAREYNKIKEKKKK